MDVNAPASTQNILAESRARNTRGYASGHDLPMPGLTLKLMRRAIRMILATPCPTPTGRSPTAQHAVSGRPEHPQGLA